MAVERLLESKGKTSGILQKTSLDELYGMVGWRRLVMKFQLSETVNSVFMTNFLAADSRAPR